MTSTTVSVVVATHNRADRIPGVVRALDAQRGAPPFELVFVDDGSTDRTGAVLAALADHTPTPVRVVRLDQNRGPAAARNAGWRSATSEIIAFTDDDCLPDPDWLANLVAALADADVAQGRTEMDADVALPGRYRPASFSTRSETGFYETCNIAYRRTVLDATGGFDPDFRAPGAPRPGRYRAPVWGEDTDLAWRAKALGARTAFVADAVVWHEAKPGRLGDRLRDTPRRAGIVHLIARQPHLRDELLVRRWFSHPAHWRLLLGLAGTAGSVLLPRRLRGLVVGGAFLPWARYRARASGVTALPGWLMIDATEVACLARASARHRTIVL